MAQQLRIGENGEKEMRSFSRVAQRGAKDARRKRYALVGADANVGTGTSQGQGVKTEVAEPSDKLQLHNWKERERLKG